MTGFSEEPDGIEQYPQLDNSEALTDTDLTADDLDSAYAPPDREPPSLRRETTAEEVLEGESLDQRLAEEQPDVDESTPTSESQPRTGRLVDSDEGALFDDERDLVAEDVGVDGGGASAEEAAMHDIDEDEVGLPVDVEDDPV